MRKYWLLVLAITLTACSTHFSTSKQKGVDGYTIYRVSQDQAFAIAYNTIATVLPGRKISKINGPVKGFSTWTRFVLDTYTQQVLVIPAIGTTKEGKTIKGFYFEVSGSGSSGSGLAKNVSLYESLQANLNQLNVASVVIKIQRGSYKQLESKSNMMPLNRSQPKGSTVEERLKKLKSLLDRGLISEKEYKDKRAKIIESL